MNGDELFVKYFEVFVEWRAKKEELCRAMKDGYWELGRARVQTLTNQQACSITSLHYDMGMKAQLRVAGELELELVEAARREDTDDEEPATSAAETEQRPRRKPPTDPLYWFGYFPPRSLRSSQQHFKSAAALAVEVATLQRRMADHQQRYLAVLASH